MTMFLKKMGVSSPQRSRRRPSAPPPTRSRRLYVRLDRSDMVKLKFLLEACDNLGYVSALDRFEAVAVITFSPDQEKELRAFLDSIQGTLRVEMLPAL